MASCLRSILTKNHYNLIILLQVTVENVWGVFGVFFETQCRSLFNVFISVLLVNFVSVDGLFSVQSSCRTKSASVPSINIGLAAYSPRQTSRVVRALVTSYYSGGF